MDVFAAHSEEFKKNTSQASIISDVNVNIGCGPEYAVASTKTFTATVLTLYITAIYLSKNTMSSEAFNACIT